MKKYKSHFIAAAVGLVLSGIGIFTQRSGFDGTAKGACRVLSDGILLGGAILTVIAIFIIAIQGGLFDGISYGASRLRRKKTGEMQQYETYYDYVTRNKKESGYKKGSPLLIPGLCYIAIAIVLTILYYYV